MSKIRDTRLLDDYPEDDLQPAERSPAPAFNPWPLEEDSPSPVMADPLSGELLVTDLQTKTEAEEDKSAAIASGGDAPSEADATMSDKDDEEPEDLTEDFKLEEEKEEGGGGDDGSKDPASHHHGDADATEDAEKDGDSDNWELIPRVDDDIDGQNKDLAPAESDTKDSTEDSRIEKGEEKEEEEEEVAEEEKEAEEEEEAVDDEDEDTADKSGDVSEDKMDTSVEISVSDSESRTDPEKTELDSSQEPSDKDDTLADLVEVDGKSSKDTDEVTKIKQNLLLFSEIIFLYLVIRLVLNIEEIIIFLSFLFYYMKHQKSVT